MKKVIFALAAVVALAACSQEDVIVADKGAAIGFDTFVENSTRSVKDPSWSNTKLFKDFGVYGYVENAKLFNNVEVKGSALNGEWSYADNLTQYWITGAKYSFAAIAPKANAKDNVFSVALDENDNYVGTTVLPFTNENGTNELENGTNDLLYAQNAQYVAGVSGQNGKVGFNFRHLLSKVKFSFENAYNASNATIRVKNVKMTNTWKSATATLGVNSTSWGSHNDATLDLYFGNAAESAVNADYDYKYNNTVETYNERLMIPGVAPEVTYTKKDAEGNPTEVTENVYVVEFTVELLVNGTVVKSYPHTAYAKFTPVAGNFYDIKTQINETNIDPDNKQESIQFTVTAIKDWGTENAVEMK